MSCMFLCLFKVIKTRKQTYKAGLEDNFKRSSFMDIILRMHIEEGRFTEDEIREEVNTFMIGVRHRVDKADFSFNRHT